MEPVRLGQTEEIVWADRADEVSEAGECADGALQAREVFVNAQIVEKKYRINRESLAAT